MLNSSSFAAAIIAALPYFLRLESIQFLNADFKSFQYEKRKLLKEPPPTFDFIIVGAGTAGCVLANRLSDDYTVLLLEAGGPLPVGVEVPAFANYVQVIPELNYFYTSIPQVNAFKRTITKYHGKMLGGSNSHNNLLQNRGYSVGYDHWARLTNDQSWNYQNLLKFFKKSENYTGKFPSDQHGTDGPVNVETEYRRLLPYWTDAAAELGYAVGDPNGPQKEEFTALEVAIKKGRRQSTYISYLEPIITTRRNLKIIKYADATEVIFKISLNKKRKQAIGIKYTRHGTEFTAFASKEVILSAGVFGTPMLLFKSGIGPSGMLQEAGITPILDLPVGRNLQDHQAVDLIFAVNDSSVLSSVRNNLTEENFKLYLESKEDGVLSATGFDPQAYIVSSVSKAAGEFKWPDLQFLNYGEVETSVVNQFTLPVFLTHPEFLEKNFGSIKLNTAAYKRGVRDNTQLAVLDYNLLASQRDYKTILNGIKIALKVFKTNSFKKLDAKLIRNVKCSDKETSTDSYWDCVIRSTVSTRHHTVGTCRMGFGKLDNSSVLDSKLRVLGMRGLRVVDASIMPEVPNSNPNWPVIVVAEKAASDILNAYK